ncbi:uncharacterized protein J3D65DRAFT_7363 [Phyllosticta citribraziliensis]|uniref:Uncharacterized protein n=1 Tax=Phyllosticta citribraziliensis TaxID=989973 RepID=A0ABR1MA48_9PEZI
MGKGKRASTGRRTWELDSMQNVLIEPWCHGVCGVFGAQHGGARHSGAGRAHNRQGMRAQERAMQQSQRCTPWWGTWIGGSRGRGQGRSVGLSLQTRRPAHGRRIESYRGGEADGRRLSCQVSLRLWLSKMSRNVGGLSRPCTVWASVQPEARAPKERNKREEQPGLGLALSSPLSPGGWVLTTSAHLADTSKQTPPQRDKHKHKHKLHRCPPLSSGPLPPATRSSSSPLVSLLSSSSSSSSYCPLRRRPLSQGAPPATPYISNPSMRPSFLL